MSIYNKCFLLICVTYDKKKADDYMVRSLWTAATGMKAQQTNVDTISNNLANISTAGYKKQTTEFKSLLYQTLQRKMTDKNGREKPVGAQVGLGVRNSAIVSRFSQGAITSTGNNLDLAITGDGFYSVALPDGSVGYTRSSSFITSIQGNGYYLATSDGYPLLDSRGRKIFINNRYPSSSLSVDKDGNITSSISGKNAVNLGYKIRLVQFQNPEGLQKASDNILKETGASGRPVMEANANNIEKSAIRQGYVEQSNVQAVEEMVALIVAQRAYEMNSKIITTSDDMLQQANNLKN